MTFQGNLWSHWVWIAIRRPVLLSKVPGFRAILPQQKPEVNRTQVPVADPLSSRQQSTPRVPHCPSILADTESLLLFNELPRERKSYDVFLFFALIITHSLTVFHGGARMKWSIFLWSAPLSNSRKLKGTTKWSEVTHCLLLARKNRFWGEKRRGIMKQVQ